MQHLVENASIKQNKFVYRTFITSSMARYKKIAMEENCICKSRFTSIMIPKFDQWLTK